jgi:alpha-L-fucosidase 2
VWNELTKPAWRGDYHSNINIQMNYWPAELTNLSECHVPLFNFVAAQAPVYRKNMLSDPQMAKRFPTTVVGQSAQTGAFGGSSWS